MRSTDQDRCAGLTVPAWARLCPPNTTQTARNMFRFVGMDGQDSGASTCCWWRLSAQGRHNRPDTPSRTCGAYRFSANWPSALAPAKASGEMGTVNTLGAVTTVASRPATIAAKSAGYAFAASARPRLRITTLIRTAYMNNPRQRPRTCTGCRHLPPTSEGWYGYNGWDYSTCPVTGITLQIDRDGTATPLDNCDQKEIRHGNGKPE